MYFMDMKKWVEELNIDWSDSKSCINFFSQFEKKWPIINILDNVLSNTTLFEDLENRMFVHPLNIYKLPLYKASHDEAEIRIHIYKNNTSDTKNLYYDEAHDHKWNLCSRILCGRFNFSYLDEAENGKIFNILTMWSDREGNNRKIMPKKTISLIEKFVVQLSSKDYYFFKNGQIHNFIPIGVTGIHATLIVRGPYILEETQMFESTEAGKKHALESKITKARSSAIRQELTALKESIMDEL